MLPLHASIEFALNKIINLDPQGYKLIQPFTDKVIKLEIFSPDILIYLLASGSHFQVFENFEGDVDTTIKMSMLNLAKLSMQNNNEKSKAVFNGNIKIKGNVALGQKFQKLFNQLDIDWEEHLSQITGDIVAHQVAKSGKQLITWASNTKKTLSLDIAEFLQYETRDLLEKREVEDFYQKIDNTREFYDRLEAKVNQLIKNR